MSTSGSAPFVYVSGPPAAGKTTLARKISKELQLPLISKDDIKEQLSDTLEKTSLLWSKRLGGATLDVMFMLMYRFAADGASAIFESNFYPHLHRDKILAMKQEYRLRTFEVWCNATDDTLNRRAKERERHRVHHQLGPASKHDNGPLALGEALLQVDTTHPERLDLELIVKHIREGIE